MAKKRYLFYLTQNYSFEILRPLQAEIKRRGDEVKWYPTGKEVDLTQFKEDEDVLGSINAAINYQPDACFVPGNNIPSFIPGIKVQVFHGLEWKKKGHFVIRGCFDLYCSHGLATTHQFEQLAEKHGYFDVVETGWPKLDNLFSAPAANYYHDDKPRILYAPTFSPSLTSAPELMAEIKKLITTKEHNWLVKFHPKMPQIWIDQYRALSCDNFQVIDAMSINELLQWADVLVSDTSSVIGEFSLLTKPVITLNNSNPGDYLLDINAANQLPDALAQAISPSDKLKQAIARYAQELHPYRDGQSSERILDAVTQILTNGKRHNKALPLNLFRNLKQRKKLNYWKI